MIVDTAENIDEIFCKRLRCRRFLGTVIEDGLAIEIGNCKVWHPAVLCCAKCNKPYKFFPRNIDEELYNSTELEEFNF